MNLVPLCYTDFIMKVDSVASPCTCQTNDGTVTILLTACRGWDSKTWNNLAVSLTRALFWYKSYSYSVNIRYCEFDIVLEILMSKYNKVLDGKGGYCFLLIHVHARGCKLLLVLIIVIAWQISAYMFCFKLYPMKFSLNLFILLLDSMLLYFVFNLFAC